MRPLHRLRTMATVAVMLGILFPEASLQAASPAGLAPTASASPSPALPISDIALGAEGSLSGLVVDVQGLPVSQAPVVLRQAGQPGAAVTTDRLGQFRISGVPGGTYQLTVGSQSRLLRLWATETAPPQAKPMAVVVVGDQVLRGQRPLSSLWTSDALVIPALVAAGIAIPLSVHHSNHSQPQSP